MNQSIASWNELKVLRDFVNQSVENARKHKQVKNREESHINLWIREDKINDENKLAEIIAAMKLFDWIDVCKINSGAYGIYNEDLPNYVYVHHNYPYYGAVVLKADGDKCARCYKISTEVGTHADCLDVCTRCVEVLRKYYPEFLTPKNF